jgi:hypothetical protein
VHAPGIADRPKSELAERARKIRPGYAEGPLVRVATARHQAEAELIQGMLLEEGIPSLSQRSGGFDVPDFLASGPRDVLVASSGADAAREFLNVPRPAGHRMNGRTKPWVRVLAAALAVIVVVLAAASVLVPLY